jgi:hypothetical protein
MGGAGVLGEEPDFVVVGHSHSALAPSAPKVANKFEPTAFLDQRHAAMRTIKRHEHVV